MPLKELVSEPKKIVPTSAHLLLGLHNARLLWNYKKNIWNIDQVKQPMSKKSLNKNPSDWTLQKSEIKKKVRNF